MSYANKAAVLDRFLAEHNVDPDDVLSVNFSKHEENADIRVHVYDQIPDLVYVPTDRFPRHYTADVDREDIVIRVTHCRREEVSA